MSVVVLCVFCFFFQAEDGIRDLTVTGVQTCALPISDSTAVLASVRALNSLESVGESMRATLNAIDRKSTRLNSSHSQISYAVFCLKKKKQKTRSKQSNYNTTHETSSIHIPSRYKILV